MNLQSAPVIFLVAWRRKAVRWRDGVEERKCFALVESMGLPLVDKTFHDWPIDRFHLGAAILQQQRRLASGRFLRHANCAVAAAVLAASSRRDVPRYLRAVLCIILTCKVQLCAC